MIKKYLQAVEAKDAGLVRELRRKLDLSAEGLRILQVEINVFHEKLGDGQSSLLWLWKAVLRKKEELPVLEAEELSVSKAQEALRKEVHILEAKRIKKLAITTSLVAQMTTSLLGDVSFAPMDVRRKQELAAEEARATRAAAEQEEIEKGPGRWRRRQGS